MKFNIITIFPNLISDYCDESILGRAQGLKLIEVNAMNLRDFSEDKHQSVDGTPYGGGAGMVMKPEPIHKALDSLDALAKDTRKWTILLSPRGRPFDQRLAEEWAKLKEITFVCGRYEGVDQRVADYMVDEEISVGPYVLAGGELGALVIIEAISRLLPGVLGNKESLKEETFSMSGLKGQMSQPKDGPPPAENVVEYPQYTKPEDFNGWKVPDILLSGHHKNIADWRREISKKNPS